MKPYQLGLYEKAMPSTLTWRERLSCAKEAGFDFVELSIDESDSRLARLDWSSAERLALIRMMDEIGVSIRSMCLSGHRKYPIGSHDAEICTRGMQIMEKAIKLAADLGIRMIQLAGYDVYYEESDEGTRRRFEENLRRCVDMAASAGVMLGFETMETAFMNTVEKAMAHVYHINSPYLGVYPDIGNITNAAVTYGTDVLEDLNAGRGHLIAMHLKETMPNVFREVPFGTGHVDFAAAIDTAWKLGIRRYVTEFWYVGGDAWREDLKAAQNMMAPLLDRMGGCA